MLYMSLLRVYIYQVNRNIWVCVLLFMFVLFTWLLLVVLCFVCCLWCVLVSGVVPVLLCYYYCGGLFLNCIEGKLL